MESTDTPPQLAPPPQFGRQQAYRQADPGSLRNDAQPELEVTKREVTEREVTVQQRDRVPPAGQSDIEVPATVQMPGPLADFGARATSFLIDYVTPVIVLTVLLSGVGATASAALSLVFTVVGYLGLLALCLWNSCYRQGTPGQSVGRRVAGTKLVMIETGQPVGSGRALLRQFCHSLEFFIGFLWPLWDDKRQTFADKIVRTVVIRVEG